LERWEVESKLKAEQWATEYERSAVLSGRRALKNRIILDGYEQNQASFLRKYDVLRQNLMF